MPPCERVRKEEVCVFVMQTDQRVWREGPLQAPPTPPTPTTSSLLSDIWM